MKLFLLATAVLATVTSVSAAPAQVAGAWRVSGKVSGFAFTLNCDFKSAGDNLGGVCVDASTSDARFKAGKSHELTAGSVHGGAVTWTYRSSFMLSKFDVIYQGTMAGPRMRGTISAGGRTGEFTAVKN